MQTLTYQQFIFFKDYLQVLEQNLSENYRITANNSGRLVKFKASLVEVKATSIRVSRKNACFCSDLPLRKFI